MATIITKQSKGSGLTHAEVDSNFTNLNNDLLTKAGLALNNTLTGNNKFTGRIQVGDTPGTDVGVALGRLGVHNTGGASIFASTVSGASAIMASSTSDVSYGSIGNYDVIMKVNGAEVGRFTPTMTKVLGNLAVGAITTPQTKLHVLTTNPITSRFQNVQTMIDFGQLSKGVAFVQSKLLNGTASSLIINPEGGQVYVGADTQRVKIDNRVSIYPNPKTWVHSHWVVDTDIGGLMSWGYNANGQGGDLTTVVSGLPKPMRFGADTTKPPSTARVIDIQIAGGNTYILYDNGWVYSTGANGQGQLGHGNTTHRTSLKRIEYFVTNNIFVSKIIAGSNTYQTATIQTYGTVFAIGNTNSVYTWGGTLIGNGSVATGYTTPQLVLSSTDLRGVWVNTSDNASVHCFINDAGILKSFGGNYNGACGVGSNTVGINTITNCVGIVGNVVDVLVKSGHGTGYSTYYCSTVALTDDGKVWSTGYNANGQLGLNNTIARNTFAQVAEISAFATKIYTQYLGPYGCTYALDTLGRIWSWGYGATGGRADGLVTDKPTPSVIGTSYQDIFLLGNSSTETAGLVFGKKLSNEIVVWGYVNSGECAVIGQTLGATVVAPQTLDLPKFYQGEYVDQITGYGVPGGSRLYLITNFGRMFATGYNVNGELGTHQPNAPARTYGWKSIDFN